ncbi:Predicted dehydrogenase [Bryocella elongata]|uniref:Predicted dehydrogenase n=1 Tax=Bryocella elongata TaxID=863522 RepID=A0A1H5UUC7_9BACT|nr:oxidoreductase [Bryocella elongata]SEF77817.1 Predicted dehydrogenase [Bryocella elongata]
MSATERIVRVALIGYGFAGKVYHAPLIRSVPGLALAVVGSSRSEAVHADIPDTLVCTAEDAATHPSVDLVVIATPNESHFALAATALRADKDVVVDKPFTITLAEARSLAEIARQHGRILSVFHNRRWESEVLAAKAMLESGALGEVSHYECHMDRYRPVVRERWRESAGPGAGLWFDLGPHLIDQALHLFGLPQSVNAGIATLRSAGQTDDWAHVQLNYTRNGKDHLRVVLHCTLLAAGGGPRSMLHGTRASWMKYGADVQEQQLKEGMLPDDPRFGVDPDAGILVDGATGTRTTIPVPRGEQRRYYIQIRDAILKGQVPPISVGNAIAVMAILEASFESAARGQVLPLPLTAAELAEWHEGEHRDRSS